MDKLTAIDNFKHGQGMMIKKFKIDWNNFIISWGKFK